MNALRIRQVGSIVLIVHRQARWVCARSQARKSIGSGQAAKHPLNSSCTATAITIESTQRVLSAHQSTAEWPAHRVEHLHGEGLPAARAPAVCEARPALADPT